MNELKRISIEAVPRALELAERYRLLDEPEQAASICQDILAVDPDNAQARRALLLATTDLFGRRRGAAFEDADRLARQMPEEYDRAYYGGIACERWARAKLQEGAHPAMVADWVHRAMDRYAAAESLRPPGNDDAVLRWNACVRLLQSIPEGERKAETETVFGDW